MKQEKRIQSLKYFLIAVVAVLCMLAAIILMLPPKQDAPTVAYAFNSAYKVLPSDLEDIFTDYTLTSLNEDYDTLEELDDLKKKLGENANAYAEYLTRAEDIVYGKVRFNGMREFSTEAGAHNPINQYGNLYSYQLNTLKWFWAGNVSQVTGIYGISNEQFTVYVDADDTAYLPTLVFAQSKGLGYSGINWRSTLTLQRGINTFTFPFANNTGDKGGVIYINNPYTEDTQKGDVSLYIEGGGFYPVYQRGDDEDVFVDQVKEFYEQRQKNFAIPDIAELLPDYALLTITASSVYDAYVKMGISPAKNIEFWSNYFTKTFEFNGMSANDTDGHAVEPYVRINIRHMAVMPNAGAYTYYYHIGVYSNEDKWFANYTDTTLDDYTRFAKIGHEIGHTLDTNGRRLSETTNNMNAAYAYYRILGKSPISIWLPFNRAQKHIFSDYTLDYKAFDDGYIIYSNPSNYDHNYLMWWYLESVFPGYWSKLNNFYRYDAAPSGLNINELMVYYSSLATGVDLSNYFHRWGMYLNSWSNRFRITNTSQAFKNAMLNAKNNEQIKEVYDHFWYVDASQFDFTVAHLDIKGEERAYKGEAPKILSVKAAENNRALEIGGHADPNLLGYEIYSSTDGVTFQVAGFTYSTKFTDTNSYSVEPTYKVKGVNRYFEVSDESATVTGTTEVPQDIVCRYNDKLYSDLKTAFDEATKANGTVYLLADCTASGLQLINESVTIEVDKDVVNDITITNTTNTMFFSTFSQSSNLVLKGNERSNIILDGGNVGHLFPAFFTQQGKVQADYVVVRNYSSNSSINGVAINADNATFILNYCRFENCTASLGAIGAIAAGPSTTLNNCVFEGITTTKPDLYSGAIGFNKSGGGSIELDGCTFKGNDGADIYVNGNYTFKNGIPKAVIGFEDGYKSADTVNCSEQDVGNLTLNNGGYRAAWKDGKIEFVELEYRLTFQLNGYNHVYPLKGTNEFVFGTEELTIDEGKYIAGYVLGDREYHIGDIITVDSDLTFTVEIERYMSLTLKYLGTDGVAEKKVQLKQDGKFYLPRRDDNNREVVQWMLDSSVFWAGDQYNAKENDTLFAIYTGLFNYRVVCYDEVQDYGYAEYDTRIDFNSLHVERENLVYWRIGSLAIEPDGEYFLTGDTVLVGVYSDGSRTFYNLSESDVTLQEDSYTYSGDFQTPDVTITIGGNAVPKENYKIIYRNNINAGAATISIEPMGYYSYGSKNVTFDIRPVTYSQSEFNITNIVSEIAYSGYQTAQTPAIKWNNVTLTADKDYTVRYSGNRVNVGSVTVTIDFIGNFLGQTSFSYQIIRADRSSFKVEIDGWTYGQAANAPTLWNYGKEKGEVTYTYAPITSENYQPTVPTAAGTYRVKAVMAQSNNYNSAEAIAQFTISKATITDVPKDFSVDSRKTTLRDVADRLPQGWSWINDTTALVLGVNRAEAVYIDTENYTNPRVEVKITVTEYKISIEQSNVTVLGSCIYNGEAQRPAVKVELNGETLIENIDYVLAYSNNINAGTGTVTVSGAGVYVGSKAVDFTIAKQDISDRIELSVKGVEFYDGIYKIAYDGEYHSISAIVGGMEAIIVVVDTSSVKNVGEYTVTATISSDNYCGEKEFAVLVYKVTATPDETEPSGDAPAEESDNFAAVVIGIAAGVVGVVTIGLVIYLLIRRRKRR